VKRLLGIALIGLAACHTMQKPPPDLPYPPQRIFQNAYSFMPPAEFGWKTLVRNPHQLALARAGSTPDETFAIQARMFALPAFSTSEEFVEIIRKGLAEQAADARYNVLRHDVGADSLVQASCARSHFVAEDHAAVKRTAMPGVLVLEVMTLSCAHPKNRNWGVTLVYSHRYDQAHADSKFTEKAAAFLSSLEFLE